MKEQQHSPNTHFIGYCPICNKPIFDCSQSDVKGLDAKACRARCVDSEWCKKYPNSEWDCTCDYRDVYRAYNQRILELKIDLDTALEKVNSFKRYTTFGPEPGKKYRVYYREE